MCDGEGGPIDQFSLAVGAGAQRRRDMLEHASQVHDRNFIPHPPTACSCTQPGNRSLPMRPCLCGYNCRGEYEDACRTTPMLAGLSRGRDDYSSEADDSEDGSEGGEDDYRPDYGARGKAAAGKRRRGHGQLPAALAAAAGRVSAGS